ncbi:hypothetical protein [Legionella spiritensis]|uniref:hypothetical protein n=1 Tax=Legionella spiritensis TaxID=452 RepID=UPI000F706035|nr:hypothetical protein [Legionella spiritensis]VEG89949.1 Endonuclease/Exonuclease/phosphatase family [Legionella spiritensis]
METIYSDHLPKLYDIPLDKDNSLTVLSYNTLSEWFFPGFETKEKEPESEEQRKQRHDRISQSIAETIEFYSIDIISLQETSEDLLNEISKKLGPDWKITFSDGNRALLYKDSEYEDIEEYERCVTPTSIASGGLLRNEDFPGISLRHKASGKTIALFPIHIPHHDEPADAEQALQAISREFGDNHDFVIFTGDFNRRIAHTGKQTIDNANNIVPPLFRNEHKFYDFTDGCFVCHDGQINQLDGITICPPTPAFEMARRTTFNEPPDFLIEEFDEEDEGTSSITEPVYPEDNTWYPVMFGQQHQLPVVGLKAGITVETLVTGMREKTGDKDLTISIGVSRFNQKMICIFSVDIIPELEAAGLTKNDHGAYELQFDYSPVTDEKIVNPGFRVRNGESSVTIPVLSLVSLSSLTDPAEIEIISQRYGEEQAGTVCAIKNATQQYIAWMNENTQGKRFLSRFQHFYHGESGVKRAQHILQLINDGAEIETLHETVLDAMRASGHRQHSYSRFLYQALHPEKQILNSNYSDKDFKTDKNEYLNTF